MSKIRVLADHVANQIAAGEVVERPMSVAKELVENAIDAGARRLQIDVEAGGRKLIRVVDDGEGMTRYDALLAFERHATSKISSSEDLFSIETLGFRGEALASIASVARVELLTAREGEPGGTRVVVEGGRMRDVTVAARPRGTTVAVRELFFNVPARRKFLRSEATESFHLNNLITHYALAHPEIAVTLTNNGREVLRTSPAADLRERAYQIFGADFLANLLELPQGELHPADAARVRGYVSAPRERRTSRDAQYLFVNGRYVRDRLLGRALSEGYRGVLPPGAFPVALLFLEVPREDVDVNVHPAKTEVRFRRAIAVSDAVRDAVSATLRGSWRPSPPPSEITGPREINKFEEILRESDEQKQSAIAFGSEMTVDEVWRPEEIKQASLPPAEASQVQQISRANNQPTAPDQPRAESVLEEVREAPLSPTSPPAPPASFPSLISAVGLVREVEASTLSANIRPLGQLEDTFIIAVDEEGLLLIDQHLAHERILYERYRTSAPQRTAESQHLLLPETFDLTPAQASAFEAVRAELESYGFDLMRLSGRTVAVKAVPADLPAGEARNLLAEVLDNVDLERRGATRHALHDKIAAALACRAAVKANTPLAADKMRWLINKLLTTSLSAATLHGRPIILRIATKDLEKSFMKG